LRRQMLRYARSIPRGSERNERRHIADSLRRLFKNKDWLKAHLVKGSATEYRVNTVDPDGTSHQKIKLNSPDDATAAESAKQFIDGKESNSGRIPERLPHSGTSRSKAASVWRPL
jgi:hypothetical protein